MGELGNALKGFVQFLGRNKGKIALIPLIALIWIPFLFPYSDLRAVVATTLSRAMGDGTAIDFEKIVLSPGFPIALELENVEFNGPGLPPIEADRLIARPSLLSLISKSPSGTIEAEGLFKGNFNAHLSSGAKLKGGGTRQDLQTGIAGLQLAALTDALRRIDVMTFNIQGSLDTDANLSIDPQFVDQPIADVSLRAKSVAIPSLWVPIPNMSSVQTPSLQFAKIDFKGKMAEGKVQIEDFTFGQTKDSLSGRIRGELGLALRKDGARVQATPGALDLKIELLVAKSLMQAMTKTGAALPLLIVDKFKTETADSVRYAFRVRSQALGAAPTFEALSTAQ